MSKIKTLVLGAAVFAAAFFAYSNTLKNGFCWDDHILIEQNAFLAEPHALKTLVEQIDLAPVVPILSAARPIFLASLVLDHRIWGDGPFGYHLTSVVLHGLNAVLVWRAGLLFLNPDAALISGLVFAVHPVNTEAVNMPSFRPDILAVLFMLLALMAYRRMESAPEPGSAGAALAAAGMAYALGSFSKETALVLPAALLWFDLCFLERPWRAKFWRRLAAMLLFGYLALYYWHFRSGRSGYKSISSQAAPAVMAIRDDASANAPPASPREVVLNPSTPQWDALYHSPELNFRSMCVVFADYARLMVLPYPLHADRAPPLIPSWTDLRFLAALALFAFLLAAGACAYAAGARPLCWGLGWWLIMLLPASNVVRLYNPMAERYLYPAAVGFAWIAGWAASLAISRAGRSGPKLKLSVLLAAGAGLALLSSMTRARNDDWKSDAVLFGREAALGSKNARIYYNLGFMAQAQGDLDKAERDYKTALALNPRYIEAMNNLAGLQEIKGESRRALKLYSDAAGLNPGNSIPYDSLGAALAKKGRIAAAVTMYHKALQENPNDTAAQISMARLQEKTGRPDLAAYQLQEAVRKKPQNFEANFALASLLDNQGEPWKAAKVWVSFLAASPKDARAMMNLGVEYDHAEDCPQALSWLDRSVSRNPKDAAARYN
ncbi:MAG: tetratricopeptide repeat protein, partial [Elusimicrobia bacterium]|nr:tetratricopeptide repeat protein [Elusimicrobiota bacterium]